MIDVQLKNGKIYKFAEDISMKALHDLGIEPRTGDPQEQTMDYNKKKLIAFSVEPKLSMEILNEMESFDFMHLFRDVIVSYNKRMKDFMTPPKVETKSSP